MITTWTRRTWLTHTTWSAIMTGVSSSRWPRPSFSESLGTWFQSSPDAATGARVLAQAERLEDVSWQTLAQEAVDAARTAGAQYADARLTRIIQHKYSMAGTGVFFFDKETVGVGVRALVNGYWGFAASPSWTSDEVVLLARDAVAQATENAKGTPRSVDLGHIPVVTGAWTTPIRIDPFTVSIEEKLDSIVCWKERATRAGMEVARFGLGSGFELVRQERVVATSEGSLFTQALYHSDAGITLHCPQLNSELNLPVFGDGPTIDVHGIDLAAVGWELLLDANLSDPATYARLETELRHIAAISTKPGRIGRYTLVCDGRTMASIVGRTLGTATQVDRAFGYEANARGTSIIDDPLTMIGTFPLASPLVTVSANRSAPRHLATVQWDDEGVEPQPFTLVKDGVLVDFQTTREQAAWLAPYYRSHGRPIRSNGCAASDSALAIPMQHMPNLTLEPSASANRLDDLIADVADGIFIAGGNVQQLDAQARNGLLSGTMREIKNGRLGSFLVGGSINLNTQQFWKNVTALGGSRTQDTVNYSGLDGGELDAEQKGEPPQSTGYGITAAAAKILSQPLIDPSKRA